jgi:methylmalonyl-CoA mutase N-terminal domain/subunit
VQREIQNTAYAQQLAVERGDRVIVGLNRYTTDRDEPIPRLTIDPALEGAQVERLRAFRMRRDQERTTAACRDVESTARGDANLMPPILAAVKAGATVGEISDALRNVFGAHVEHVTL